MHLFKQIDDVWENRKLKKLSNINIQTALIKCLKFNKTKCIVCVVSANKKEQMTKDKLTSQSVSNFIY